MALDEDEWSGSTAAPSTSTNRPRSPARGSAAPSAAPTPQRVSIALPKKPVVAVASSPPSRDYRDDRRDPQHDYPPSSSRSYRRDEREYRERDYWDERDYPRDSRDYPRDSRDYRRYSPGPSYRRSPSPRRRGSPPPSHYRRSPSPRSYHSHAPTSSSYHSAPYPPDSSYHPSSHGSIPVPPNGHAPPSTSSYAASSHASTSNSLASHVPSTAPTRGSSTHSSTSNPLNGQLSPSASSSHYALKPPTGPADMVRRGSASSSRSSNGDKKSPLMNGWKALPPAEAVPPRPAAPSTSSFALPSKAPSARPSSTYAAIRPPSTFNKLPAFFYKTLGAKDYRVMYDPALDPNPIKKGKEVIKRYDGEGVKEEVKDPRKTEDPAEKAKLEKKKQRGPFMRELGVLTYSWDKNSTGPPPPAPPSAILVTGFPSATTGDAIHAHFRSYGRIEQQEVKYDVQTGGSLGICWIKYIDDVPRDAEPDKPTRERYERKRKQGQVQDGSLVAQQAVTKGNGAKVGMAMLMGDVGVKVELDADGAKCKAAVKAEMARRHPPKPAPKKPPPQPTPMSRSSSSSATPKPTASTSSLPPAPPSLPPPPPPPTSAPPPPPDRPPPPPPSSYGRGGRFGQPIASSSRDSSRYASLSSGPRHAARGTPPSTLPSGSRSASQSTHVSIPSLPISSHPSSAASRLEAATHVSVPTVAIPPLPSARPPMPPKASSRGSLPSAVSYSSTSSRFGGGVGGRKGGARGGGGGRSARPDNMASVIATAVEAAKKRLAAHQQQTKGGLGGKKTREEGEADMEMDSDQGSRTGSGSGAGGASEESEEEEGDEDEEQVDKEDAIFYHHHASGRTEPRRILPRGFAPVNAIAWQASKKVLLDKLASNGKPYLKIDKTVFQDQRAGQGGRSAVPNAEELERHFRKYEIDRTFADSEGWYITFNEGNAARSAFDVLNGHKFGGASLQLILCDPPSSAPTPSPSPAVPAAPTALPSKPSNAPAPGSHLAALVEKLSRRPAPAIQKKRSGWTQAELVEEAKEIVVAELLETFQNDLKARLVRGKVQEHLQIWERNGSHTSTPTAPTPIPAFSVSSVPPTAIKTESLESPVDPTASSSTVKSLSSLSFSKRKSATSASYDDRRRRRDSVSTRFSSEAPSESPAPGFGSDADDVQPRTKERSKKKKEQKSKVSRAYSDSDEESSEDDRVRRKKAESAARKKKAAATSSRKKVSVDYTSSEDEAEEQQQKLPQVKEEEDVAPVEATPAPSPSPELDDATPDITTGKTRRDTMAMDDDDDEAAVASPPRKGKLVRGRKPKVEEDVKPRGRQPIPMPASLDPFEAGLAGDEEDLFYLKLALERLQLGQDLHPSPPPSDDESAPPHKHSSGSARTEGFYTITVEEKMANRPATNRAKAAAADAQASSVAVSRLARANTRGLVRGMELHKKVTATDTDVLKFNQLKTRKKQLTFSRSGIEGYGLFAREFIPSGDMVIEYVGELIRQQVADRREKAYERQGIGSSYLFRVDEDLVVDATKKGNLGRLINHCCAPNCTARIITINGIKKIVIYAKANIHPGEEVTYDYHFPIEEDNKIPCLCGAPTCRRYLN
ncbi:hypothetical protein JCM11641_002844 [Rhodosporidiobolus odoratus]